MQAEEYQEAVHAYNRAQTAAREVEGSESAAVVQDKLAKAEAALKQSKTKDYYKVGGTVPRSTLQCLYVRRGCLNRVQWNMTRSVGNYRGTLDCEAAVDVWVAQESKCTSKQIK